MFHDKHFTAGQFFVTKKEFYVIFKIFIRFLFSLLMHWRVQNPEGRRSVASLRLGSSRFVGWRVEWDKSVL